jgi:hypothetical protein
MAHFRRKSQPSVCRRGGFVAMRGSPAVKVPAGQMYLQKAGSPIPAVRPFVRRGRATTKTTRSAYLTYRARRNRAGWIPAKREVLKGGIFSGILCNNSCINPKGHRKPQIKRPKRRPNPSISPVA